MLRDVRVLVDGIAVDVMVRGAVEETAYSLLDVQQSVGFAARRMPLGTRAASGAGQS